MLQSAKKLVIYFKLWQQIWNKMLMNDRWLSQKDAILNEKSDYAGWSQLFSSRLDFTSIILQVWMTLDSVEMLY